MDKICGVDKAELAWAVDLLKSLLNRHSSKIIHILNQEKVASVSFIQEKIGVAQPTISTNIAKLCALGFVRLKYQKDHFSYYELCPKKINKINKINKALSYLK